MTTRKLQTLQGGKVVPIESENEELDFGSVRIGSTKAAITEIAPGTVGINAKIRVTAGTDNNDVAVKSQVDAASSGAAVAIQAEEDRAIAAEGALDGRLDTAEATLVSHGSRITDNETDIGSLQGDLASILANNPRQGRFVVGVGGATTFDVSTLVAPQVPFTFSADNGVFDVELIVNGYKWTQCRVGDFSTGGFRKNSDSIIETSISIAENAEVVVWKQGTSSTGGGGGGADLDAITTNPKPAINGGQSLGTVTKAWESVFIKDTATAQVYQLVITNGIVDFVEVP